MNSTQPGTLVLVLPDQLSANLSALAKSTREDDVVFLAELRQEATYVKYHKKKLAFSFSAMRHFAVQLREAGWGVDYVKLDAPGNTGSLQEEIRRALTRHGLSSVRATEPSEWRVRRVVEELLDTIGCSVEVLPDERFLATHQEFEAWADGRKQLRMEYFYRAMRRKTGLLLENDQPAGGKWNFDSDNRQAADGGLEIPQIPKFKPDSITRDVLRLVDENFPDHFGQIEPFWFAVTAKDAHAALDHFITERLPRFGDYQDAMLTGERFLYHSVLSPYINVGLLDVLYVCERAAEAYSSGDAPLNAVEGFIRQLIGWREYIRGIYWLKMPEYAALNFLGGDRKLPDFYWTGDTDMHCMAQTISQTREEAYAHHIQRLMVTGNFAMLTGVNPTDVHEWYLAVYADAYEWVELPNVIGMSQFADEGLLGSKPYAASGNYINKMSNYCASCRFDVKEKTGDNACPFNALYWDFLARNEEKLGSNPRLRNAFATWHRMSADKRDDYRQSAANFLASL
jgi:deoxyribodipyrimidine photolyase-related protein